MNDNHSVRFSVDYPDCPLNRVVGYAFILITDRYPPFRLRP